MEDRVRLELESVLKLAGLRIVMGFGLGLGTGVATGESGTEVESSSEEIVEVNTVLVAPEDVGKELDADIDESAEAEPEADASSGIPSTKSKFCFPLAKWVTLNEARSVIVAGAVHAVTGVGVGDGAGVGSGFDEGVGIDVLESVVEELWVVVVSGKDEGRFDTSVLDCSAIVVGGAEP